MLSGRECIVFVFQIKCFCRNATKCTGKLLSFVVLQESVRNLGCLPELCDGAYFLYPQGNCLVSMLVMATECECTSLPAPAKPFRHIVGIIVK
jgi:hypothetical protein